MKFSGRTLMVGAGVIAAFSVGGFAALQTSQTDQLAEAAPAPENSQPRSIDVLSLPASGSESVTVSKTGTVKARLCNQLCEADVETFKRWSEDNDETSETALARVEDYAAFIAERPALRYRLIDIAATHPDPKLRRLIVASFGYLGGQDQMDLGRAMMASNQWEVRHGAVELLTNNEVLASQDAAEIVAIISKENNANIAKPIFRALGQSSVVSDKAEIMGYINQRVSSGLDSDIRGAALVAQTQLTLDAVIEIPAQVVESLQSGDPEYSVYGLQATDLILSNLSKTGGDENSPAFQQAKQVLEGLIYNEYVVLPDSVLRKADYLYLRYFG